MKFLKKHFIDLPLGLQNLMRSREKDPVEKIGRLEMAFPLAVVQTDTDIGQDVCLFSCFPQIPYQCAHTGMRGEVVSVPVLKAEADRAADLIGGCAGQHLLQRVVLPDQTSVKHDPFSGVIDEEVDLPDHVGIRCVFPCGIIGVVIGQNPSHVKYDVFVSCHCCTPPNCSINSDSW